MGVSLSLFFRTIFNMKNEVYYDRGFLYWIIAVKTTKCMLLFYIGSDAEKTWGQFFFFLGINDISLHPKFSLI